MSAENTIEQLQSYCTKSSGDKLGQIWQGKSATYFWNVGKTAADGILNGVVRKLAGIDASGVQIWVVAGSFKIAPDGTILRFTGLPKKDQTMISRMAQIKVEARNTVKESVTA
jgi:hypothetical protein